MRNPTTCKCGLPKLADAIACPECEAVLAADFPDGQGGIDYKRLWVERGDASKLPPALRASAEKLTDAWRSDTEATAHV